MSDSPRHRYRQIIGRFTAFLIDEAIPLDDIKPSTIELFKADRHKKIAQLKQSRGGSGVALEIAVMHRLFKFAGKKQLINQNPIDPSRQSKPAEKPKKRA